MFKFLISNNKFLVFDMTVYNILLAILQDTSSQLNVGQQHDVKIRDMNCFEDCIRRGNAACNGKEENPDILIFISKCFHA